MIGEFSRVTGEKKSELVAQAEDTPDFHAYKDYFVDRLGYNIVDTHVTKKEGELGKTEYIISFTLDDRRPDTKAEINIPLEDGEDEVVDSGASVDYYDDGELREVEHYYFEDDQVKQKVI